MALFYIHINERGEYSGKEYNENAKKLVDIKIQAVDFIVGNCVLGVDFKMLDDCVQGVAMLSYGYKYFNGKTLFEAEQKVIDFIAEQEARRVIRKIENGAKVSVWKNNELSTNENVVYSYKCL